MKTQRYRENLEAISDGQWEQTLRTCIFGDFSMARAALPHLRSGSAILHTGSITGLEGSAKLLDSFAATSAVDAPRL